MIQRFTTPIPIQAPSPDTAVHQFAVTPASGPGTVGGMVYLTTPAANQGTVTISDGSGNAGGLVLGPGVGVTLPVVMLGPILDFNAFGYQFSIVGDVLNVLLMT